MLKIYTKTGDQGQTALFGGARVSKSHLRVEAYGTVDELNAFTGLLRDALDDDTERRVLGEIQNRLFTIGAHLASDPAKPLTSPDVLDSDVALLESEMDRMTVDLPPLRHFILPGGHEAVSRCHLCRTVCRRAERQVVALREVGEVVGDGVLEYLNRLSDYFFVLGREVSHRLGVAEVVWRGREEQQHRAT